MPVGNRVRHPHRGRHRNRLTLSRASLAERLVSSRALRFRGAKERTLVLPSTLASLNSCCDPCSGLSVDIVSSIGILSGSGSPEGVVTGTLQGQLYTDILTGTLYQFTGTINTTVGWFPSTFLNVLALAKGDWNGSSGTDDTLAIQAIFDRAYTLVTPGNMLTSRPTVYFPRARGYRITSPVICRESINVIMDAPIVCDASSITALTIGSPTVNNTLTNHVLRVVSATQSAWSTESSLGLKLVNLYASTAHVIEVRNFTVGVQCAGDSGGFAYSKVFIGLLNNNKIGIDITNRNVGFCNQNDFFGGSFTNDTGVGTNLARYGIRTRYEDGSNTPNNLVFHTPSFELNKLTAGASEAVPWICERGTACHIIDARSEINSTTLARIQNDSVRNHLSFLVGNGTISYEGDFMDTYVIGAEIDGGGQIYSEPAWHSGPIHLRACYADGASAVNVPRLVVGSSSGDARFSSLNGFTINAAYLEIGVSRSLGIFVDTSVAKRFRLNADCIPGFDGRWLIVCYDSSGTIYTAVDALKWSSGLTLSPIGSFGGGFQSGGDNDNTYYLQAGANVKSLRIMKTPGTAVCRIRSFTVYSLDRHAVTAWPGYEEIVPGCNIGSTFPTAGTWAVGRTLYNEVPATGQPQGWVCTTAPLTFRPLANIA